MNLQQNLKNEPGIYKLVSLLFPNKIYIGSSRHIRKRFIQHRSCLNRNKHGNAILQNHVNKYGLEDLTASVLEYCDLKDLVKIEQNYIDTLKPSFNISSIVQICSGKKLSKERCQKLSDFHKGRVFSEEHCRRISESKKGVKIGKIRKPMSRETINKIIETRKKNYVISDETRKKLSDAGKLRKHSLESIQKRVDKLKGRPFSDKAKENVKLAAQKRNIKLFQYDLQMNFIKEWESMTEASNTLKINLTCISLCCQEKIKTSGGYIFKKKSTSIIMTAKELL